MYDEEYLSQKTQRMQSFFDNLESISKSEGSLQDFINKHNSKLQVDRKGILEDTSDKINAQTSHKKEGLDKNKSLKENRRINQIRSMENEKKRIDQFKIFILEHQKNKGISVKEFDRLSANGRQINKINSKYLNHK